MVWIKARNATKHHVLAFSHNQKFLRPSDNDAYGNNTSLPLTFVTNGFFIPGGGLINQTGEDYIAWSFKCSPRFFEFVEYTGTGVARTVNHGLGSVPGFMLVKSTNVIGNWFAYHRSNTSNPETDYLWLNSPNATVDADSVWNDTAPTATEFTVGTGATNLLGVTYIALLFAHDVSSQGIVQCEGGVTDGGGTSPPISLNSEPQWLLIKESSISDNWTVTDNLRGLLYPPLSAVNLYANTNATEVTGADIRLRSTGFQFVRDPSANFVYVAIRGGTTTPPASATSVFTPALRTGTGASGASTALGRQVDLVFTKQRSSTQTWAWTDRLRGATQELSSVSNAPRTAYVNDVTSFVSNTGFLFGTGASGQINTSGSTYIDYLFRRAAGFFDRVIYTGTGANLTVPHSLLAAPSLIIVKSELMRDWYVYYGDVARYVFLNQSAIPVFSSSTWNNTTPTSSGFTVGTSFNVNSSGEVYNAFLFANLPGIQSIGQYTGNGSTQAIDCDFRTGARFILIKRIDSSGPWYIWDSVRGISSDTDPYVLINSTAAEVTTNDSVDNYSGGFYVYQNATTNINVLNGTYLFWAIA